MVPGPLSRVLCLMMVNVTRVNATYGPNPAQPAATFFQPTVVANPRQFQFALRYRF